MWPANVLKSSQGGNTCSLAQMTIPLARVVWWQTREACLSLGRTCGAAGWENSNSAIKGGSAKSYIRGAEGGPGIRVCWTCGRQENKQIITRRMEKCGRRGEITDFCCSELGQSFKDFYEGAHAALILSLCQFVVYLQSLHLVTDLPPPETLTFIWQALRLCTIATIA